MKFILQLIAAVFLYISVPAQTVNQDSATGNVYALLVGISKYSDPDIPPLQFADRDAVVFADFLQSKAGGSVPKDNIRLLTNANASTAAVTMAIKWLVRTCKKGDLVFFYFSGHGDLESITMFNQAYLICYNTPVESYESMSLSVNYLNDIAFTLSAKTGANVVLITDACHSGKMADSKVNELVGQQLMASKAKEIRIASCKADQLSNEKTDWGGGRGVFSYYLVNGLKGLADQSNDGIVSLGEIKNYLQSSMANDPVLRQENKIQIPVLKGNDDFTLAKADAEELIKARQLSAVDSVSMAMLAAAPFPADDLPEDPEDYFRELLKKESLESLTESLKLDKMPAADIPVALVKRVRDSVKKEAGIKKLDQLLNNLESDAESLTRFKESLVIAFDDRAQEVINQYLKGDAAELERRRYYNVTSSGYDVYPRMFAVALQLTEPGSFYYNILQVKLHYFTGVALRLKIPITEYPESLIDQALAEQKKALQLGKHAAYIYNELGVLYDMKEQYPEAEKHYKEAIKKKPEWALPWANLGGLYAATGKPEQGIAACKTADSLKAGIQLTTVNMGYAYEKSGNLLYAEEYYREAININSRHYGPFEGLGLLYTNTTRYALADSFFYEASLRKKEYHFIGDGLRGARDKQPATPMYQPSCSFTDSLRSDDMLGYFAMGMSAFYNLGTGPVNADGGMPTFGKNNPLAVQCFKKVIALDKKNPLVYHYLAQVYYEQQQWEEAELMFRYAMENYTDPASFKHYLDSVIRSARYPYPHDCFEHRFNTSYYRQQEDYFFIASVHEHWDRPDEAAFYYKKAIEKDPANISGYMKLWQLLEKQSLYSEAENVIKRFASDTNDTVYRELNAFYRRALEKYPDNSEWNYKLGLLLYSRAQAKTRWNYQDTIIWFPTINLEVFMPEKSERWTYKDLVFDIGPGVSDEYHPQELHTEVPAHFKIPGTGEEMYFARRVSLPRYDGIHYLKRTAALIGEKETLASINFKIGEIYVWAGSKKMALPYFENALSLDTANATTRLKIVEMSTAVYKNRKAMEQLNYLYNKKQIDFSSRLLLAKFGMYAGQSHRFLKIIDEAEAINPYPLPEIAGLRGQFNLLAHNYDKAISFYKTSLQFNPGDAVTTYTLARLYAAKKNTAEAYRWLNKAISLGFNYGFVLQYDPMLAGLRKTDRWSSFINSVQKKNWNKRTQRSMDSDN